MSDNPIKRDKLDSVLKTLADLTRQQVLVGVPDSSPERKEGPISNAAIGYINEFGAPAANIPARPHLVPGVESVNDKTAEQLKAAATAALANKPAIVETSLNRAGMVAQAAVRREITSGDFAPLSDSTLRARARRGREGAALELATRKEAGEGDDRTLDEMNANARPLIDTGQYRRSITYVLRKK